MRKLIALAVIAVASIGMGIGQSVTGQQAKNLVNGAAEVWMQDEINTPEYVKFAPGEELNPNELSGWLKQFTKDGGFGLKEINKRTDKLRQAHITYQLTYNGIPVSFNRVIAHIENGKVTSVNGNFNLSSPSTTQAGISESAALTNALNSINAQNYKWEIPAEEQLLKTETGDPSASFYPQGELCYVQPDARIDADHKLAWKFNIYAQKPLSRKEYFVDAQSGDIIFTNDQIHHSDAQGTAETKYSGTRTIVTDSVSPNMFRLRETGRGNGINTFNMQNGTNHGNAVDFTDGDNYWDNVNANQDEVATDAHWGAEMTYDYYLTQHNRNSIDGNGFALNSYVHYDNNYGNAFWDGQRMTYGDGGNQTTPFTALDITSHEITHGLTSRTADLIYSYESGALNESFSDIFGAAVEIWARPNNNNWLIGEDIGITLRSMSDPNQYGDPDTYQGDNWEFGAFDNGGVHINSGVQNYWFYLLVNGGSGTNDNNESYNVTALGLTTAAEIAFRNLVTYLSPSSEYDEARFYSIKSAVDLFGACSPEVEAVTNAWHAVGVGPAYTPNVVSDFSASLTSSCTAPLEVSFTNNSINGLNFTWDFGDGNSSTQLNPSHTYANNGSYDVQLIVDGGNCGADSVVKSSYINIGPNQPCVVTMPSLGPGEDQTSCTGRVFDSGGEQGNYGSGESSFLTIAPSGGASSVTLYINSFDVEAGSGSTCDYDYLAIYEGQSTNGTLIGKYCNTTGIPGTITSQTNAVTLHFFSDGGVENAGFDITWNCTYPDVPPAADFTASSVSDCRGTYSFSDESANGPTGWTWDFGDGNTSTDQNPTHTYTQNGDFDVTLTATNSHGTDSVVKSSHVTITKPSAPQVILTNNPGNGDSAVLTTTDSGVIYWFDSIWGGNLLDTGSTFTSAPLSSSTSFFVEREILKPIEKIGPVDNQFGSGNMFNNDQYLVFDALSDFELKTVKVFAGQAGNRTIELRNSSGQLLASETVFIQPGEHRIELDFDIQQGTDYQLGVSTNNMISLYRNDGGVQYPYSVAGLASIKRSSANSNPFGYYYFFYDWEIQEPSCISEREEVIVNLTGTDELSQNSGLTLYPNPTRSKLNVEFSGWNDEKVQIEILSSTGALVKTISTSATKATIDVSNLAAGYYLLKATGDQKTAIERIVIN
ncbi:MAG: M4 family metallopeptidase [Salibacter sp.]|uniref:M4 family metallopeptidase n=1 Tax=Salibacter sp. TaxID=2010995 RepID=UPI0028705114|nr:M4 family metallopeptidase [Salibacter sp.]MDR9399711.1 M4 family metallopeptidase [Salibacter sp.]